VEVVGEVEGESGEAISAATVSGVLVSGTILTLEKPLLR